MDLNPTATTRLHCDWLGLYWPFDDEVADRRGFLTKGAVVQVGDTDGPGWIARLTKWRHGAAEVRLPFSEPASAGQVRALFGKRVQLNLTGAACRNVKPSDALRLAVAICYAYQGSRTLPPLRLTRVDWAVELSRASLAASCIAEPRDFAVKVARAVEEQLRELHPRSRVRYAKFREVNRTYSCAVGPMLFRAYGRNGVGWRFELQMRLASEAGADAAFWESQRLARLILSNAGVPYHVEEYQPPDLGVTVVGVTTAPQRLAERFARAAGMIRKLAAIAGAEEEERAQLYLRSLAEGLKVGGVTRAVDGPLGVEVVRLPREL